MKLADSINWESGECDVQIVKRRRKGVARAIRTWWKRRSAIEPVIGHVKSESRVDRNRLGGVVGDKIDAILSAHGFNPRKLPRAFVRVLRFLCLLLGVDANWRPTQRGPIEALAHVA